MNIERKSLLRHSNTSLLPIYNNENGIRDSKSATGAKMSPIQNRQRDWQMPIKIESAARPPSDHIGDTQDSRHTSNRNLLTGSSFFKQPRDPSAKSKLSPAKEKPETSSEFKIEVTSQPFQSHSREQTVTGKTKAVNDILEELEVRDRNLDYQS